MEYKLPCMTYIRRMGAAAAPINMWSRNIFIESVCLGQLSWNTHFHAWQTFTAWVLLQQTIIFIAYRRMRAANMNFPDDLLVFGGIWDLGRWRVRTYVIDFGQV